MNLSPSSVERKKIFDEFYIIFFQPGNDFRLINSCFNEGMIRGPIYRRKVSAIQSAAVFTILP